MKATFEQSNDTLRTTPESKQNIKEELFTDIDKLAADHDVTVSNTMIKITYKKAFKDQNSSDGGGDSELGKEAEESRCPSEAEKKRKYVNGLNLVPKWKPTEVSSSGDDGGGSGVENVSKTEPESGSENNSVHELESSNNKLGVDKNVKALEGVKRKSTIELGVPKSKKLKISEGRVRRGPFKRRIMLVDPDLPTGWTRFIRIKNKGTAREQYVVYVVDPQGKKFRYRWKLRKYLAKMNSSLDADQFFFGVYEKPKTSSPDKEENNWKKEKTPEAEVPPVKTPEKKEERKELLHYDPDLPFGWKRIINSNSPNGRKQVHIISPDGTIFRRRYRLQEYLEKHQFSHSLDRFYFGLYPKKDESTSENPEEGNQPEGSAIVRKRSLSETNGFKEESKAGLSPMYDDPNLPEGWHRLIKIRTCGETAGRMEVIIVSPDGRRHRTRKHLEQYLSRKELNFNADDFDFTVFGKANTKPRSVEKEEEREETKDREEDEFRLRRRFFEKPVPELDINGLKEAVITPEGHLVHAVNGLMMCSGLTSARSERRQRVPKKEFEKELKNFLSSTENDVIDVKPEGCEIPTRWIEKLVKCRSEFRSLEPEAVTTIAETTKEFIKNLATQALTDPERGLRYEDMADFVDRTESLSFLKALIPKKITFKEFVRLNRPKQFSSFT